MAGLTVDFTVPVLLFGELDKVEGEVWLTNNTGSDITITGASLTVNFPTPETGAIPLPDNTPVAPGATKRLFVRSAMSVYTPGGTYAGQVDLATSAGGQSIAATVVIADTFVVALAPSVLTFTAVKKSSTLTGSVIVLNRGNTPVPVGKIPDENMLEIVTVPRVVEVSGATLTVEPAPGLATGGKVTFTNPTPTLAPGTWASVDVKLKMPATLTANRHFRVLPRIATQRFVVDLLT